MHLVNLFLINSLCFLNYFVCIEMSLDRKCQIVGACCDMQKQLQNNSCNRRVVGRDSNFSNVSFILDILCWIATLV